MALELEQKVDQTHSMLTQLITMVSTLIQDLNEFKQDLNEFKAETRESITALQKGQDELRKGVSTLKVGQDELRNEMVGFRAEFRERLSFQRSQIAENTEDIEVLKKTQWQTHIR